MYLVADTWDKLLTVINDLHTYLNTCTQKEDKLRLAFDIETYLCEEERARLDQEYSYKILSTKSKKLVDSGQLSLNLLQSPNYPVPRPVKDRYGNRPARVRLLQFGINPEHINIQYVIDLDKIYKSCNTDKSILHWYLEVGKVLQPIFDRATIIGQNLKYEYQFMWAFFGCNIKTMRDVFLMNQVRNMGNKITHKLSYLYKYYIPEDQFTILTGKTHDEYHLFKDEEQKSKWFIENLTVDQLKYAAEDVYLIWFVFKNLLKELSSWATKYDTGKANTGILEVVKLECELIKPVSKAEIIGFKVDRDYYESTLKPSLESEIMEANALTKFKGFTRTVETERVKKVRSGKGKDAVITQVTEKIVTREPYNLNSPYHIREILGPELCKLLPKTPTGAASTGADELIFLENKHPIIPLVRQVKTALKTMSFFESSDKGYFQFTDSDDVIHPTIHQIGSADNTIDTGRMSGSSPNIMNVPADPKVRRFFTALPGHKLVILDYSQIEPLITAEITQDPFLLTIFTDGRDLHSETAKYIFELDYLPDKHNPDHKTVRGNGKVMRLARTYLMGIDKALKKVYIDSNGKLDYILRGEKGIEEFKQVLEKFDESTPLVNDLRKRIESEVRDLPSKVGTLAKFRDGKPFYVGVNAALGRTRQCCLSPEDRMMAAKSPEEYNLNYVAYNKKTNKFSTFSNRSNKILKDKARELFNNLIQSTAADIFKIAIVEVDKELISYLNLHNLDPFLNGQIAWIHDEIIIQVKEEHANEVLELAKRSMVEAAKRFIKSVPVDVEAIVANDWSQKP